MIAFKSMMMMVFLESGIWNLESGIWNFCAVEKISIKSNQFLS